MTMVGFGAQRCGTPEGIATHLNPPYNTSAQACFSFLCTAASPVTHGSAERNQFCRFGTNSLRWRRMPTRTV